MPDFLKLSDISFSNKLLEKCAWQEDITLPATIVFLKHFAGEDFNNINIFYNEDKDTVYRPSFTSGILIRTRDEIPDEEVSDGFEYFSKTSMVGRYLSERACTEAQAFVNKERELCIIESKHLNHALLNSISALIPKLAPWLCKSGITDEIRSMLHCIEKRDFTKLISFFNANIVPQLMRDAIGKYSESRLEKCIENSKAIIDEYSNKINSYYSTIFEYQKKLADESVRYESYVNTESDSTEITEFFDHHKNVVIRDISDDEITLSIIDTIDFYDDEALERYLSNDASYFHRRGCTAKIRNVIKDVFADGGGKILAESCWRLSIPNGLYPLRGVSYDDGCLPHPHLYHYACLGDNHTPIENSLSEGDWQTALEQAIAATKNWAFTDSSVGERTMKWISENKDCKCIILPSGERTSFNDYKVKKVKADE